ncbi:MAG: hypothetical protein JW893_06445 [Candidatus Omnitrophica bacterium]|nr:hypothetical protein [Candidatus Omnitrophota bacterium]
MVKKIFCNVLILIALVFVLSGCAMMRKTVDVTGTAIRSMIHLPIDIVTRYL